MYSSCDGIHGTDAIRDGESFGNFYFGEALLLIFVYFIGEACGFVILARTSKMKCRIYWSPLEQSGSYRARQEEWVSSTF